MITKLTERTLKHLKRTHPELMTLKDLEHESDVLSMSLDNSVKKLEELDAYMVSCDHSDCYPEVVKYSNIRDEVSYTYSRYTEVLQRIENEKE